MGSLWKPVRNFKTGRYNWKPDFICIHIMQGSLAGTFSWFNNPNSGVSAHTGIGSKGEVWDFVHSVDTAWHCGTNTIAGTTFKGFHFANGKLVNPNLHGLGLEHEGFIPKEITEECYKASASKIKYWAQRYNIPIDADHIAAHKSIYPGHNCPFVSINIPKLICLAQYAEPILPA